MYSLFISISSQQLPSTHKYEAEQISFFIICYNLHSATSCLDVGLAIRTCQLLLHVHVWNVQEYAGKGGLSEGAWLHVWGEVRDYSRLGVVYNFHFVKVWALC